MPFKAQPVTVTSDEQQELSEMSISRSLPAGDVFKARLILMLAAGRSYAEIRWRLDTTAPTISHWKKRFLESRIARLTESRHPRRKPTVITPKLQARVLEATRRQPKGWLYSLVRPQTRSGTAHFQRRDPSDLA